MWIIPENLSQHFPFVPVSAASKEELSELLDRSEPLLMWRSKPRSLKIWLWASKRVSWLQHLFGRILKPSLSERFTEEYSSCWEVIPVSRFLRPAGEKEQKIQDTFGRILNVGSDQLDLFAVSSKMSSDTSALDSTRSRKAFERWIISLRQEYTQRQRLARRISAQEYLSSPSWQPPKTTSGDYTNDNGDTEYRRFTFHLQIKQWPTPSAMEPEQTPEIMLARAAKLKARNNGKNGTKYSGNGAGPTLGTAVPMWATPTAQISRGSGEGKNKQGGPALHTMVQNWTTPSTRDYKDSPGMMLERADGRSRMDQLPRQIFGLQDPASLNRHGNSRASYPERLNPAWVSQLMGTPLEKIFFVPLATESSSRQPSSPSEICSENISNDLS